MGTTIRNMGIFGVLALLLVGLAQCSPEYSNCEGYKYSPAAEIPARCLGYMKQ